MSTASSFESQAEAHDLRLLQLLPSFASKTPGNMKKYKHKFKFSYCQASCSHSCWCNQTQHTQLSSIDTEGYAVWINRATHFQIHSIFQKLYFSHCVDCEIFLPVSACLTVSSVSVFLSNTYTHWVNTTWALIYMNKHKKGECESVFVSVNHKTILETTSPILTRQRWMVQHAIQTLDSHWIFMLFHCLFRIIWTHFNVYWLHRLGVKWTAYITKCRLTSLAQWHVTVSTTVKWSEFDVSRWNN